MSFHTNCEHEKMNYFYTLPLQLYGKFHTGGVEYQNSIMNVMKLKVKMVGREITRTRSDYCQHPTKSEFAPYKYTVLLYLRCNNSALVCFSLSSSRLI